MAEEKKSKQSIGNRILTFFIAAGTVAVSGSFITAYCQQCKESNVSSNTYNQDDLKEGSPIINRTINMQPKALIYPGPDNAISGTEGKKPYFDLSKERTVVAAVYEVQNDFEIVTDRSQEINIIYNGGELVAVKTKVDGEVEGYFRIEAIYTNTKENEMVYKIGA